MTTMNERIAMSDKPSDHDLEKGNPFDLLGLDPRMSPRELTEVLRQRAERALPEERAQLQGLWRKLTLKESERIKFALLAHPRGSRQGAQKLDALRDKVPPFLSRKKLEPLTPTALDALVSPSDAAQRELPLAPPARFPTSNDPD
jgi:hypothetical protein